MYATPTVDRGRHYCEAFWGHGIILRFFYLDREQFFGETLVVTRKLIAIFTVIEMDSGSILTSLLHLLINHISRSMPPSGIIDVYQQFKQTIVIICNLFVLPR